MLSVDEAKETNEENKETVVSVEEETEEEAYWRRVDECLREQIQQTKEADAALAEAIRVKADARREAVDDVWRRYVHPKARRTSGPPWRSPVGTSPTWGKHPYCDMPNEKVISYELDEMSEEEALVYEAELEQRREDAYIRAFEQSPTVAMRLGQSPAVAMRLG